MRIRICNHRQFVISALAFLCFPALRSNAYAGTNGEPEIPAVTTTQQPQSVEQQIKLANDYFVGRGVVQNLQQSAYWFEKAAKSGDPQAQMQIGYFYDAGIGVSRNPELATHWYQLAASGGLATAKVNLGTLYYWGNGVKKNEQLAVQLFREAGKQGSGLAACYLGVVYYSGAGVPQDKAAGEQWFVKGAGLHNPEAEYDLGLLLFDRPDHVHNLPRAATLLRESAAAGYVPAMHSLGLLLVRNPALAKSPDEAVKLLKRSANAGIWKSSMILGVLARDGREVPLDSGAAYFRFRAAALQGGGAVKKLLENDIWKLSSTLGPTQAAALDSQAEDWVLQHHIVLEFVYRASENQTRFPDYALASPENGTHSMQMLPEQPD
jgi:TPR repeat protein